MKKLGLVLVLAAFQSVAGIAQVVPAGRLLYENSLKAKADTLGWKLEGKAVVEFLNDWMHVYSPNQAQHHVFWCPVSFPSDFIAEWDVQNQDPKAGLCIVFFAAEGEKEADIFSPKLKNRTGVFKQYTKGDINNYHISYYANNPNEIGRTHNRIRSPRCIVTGKQIGRAHV